MASHASHIESFASFHRNAVNDMGTDQDEPVAGNQNGRASPIVLITGLADALPDPPDSSSEDDAGDGEVKSMFMPPSPKPVDVPRVQPHAYDSIGEPVDTVRASPVFPNLVSGEESAGLLNDFIVPQSTAMVQVASSSPGGTSKSSRLKRISKPGVSTYRGINASKALRRLHSKPINIFDIDGTDPEPLTGRTRAGKAAAVDPDSMEWQIRTSSRPTKKRKPDSVTVSAQIQAGNVAATGSAHGDDDDEHGAVMSRPDAAHSLQKQQSLAKRGPGRPRKARPENEKSNFVVVTEHQSQDLFSTSLTTDLRSDVVEDKHKSHELTIDSPDSPSTRRKAASGKRPGRPRKSIPNDAAVGSEAQHGKAHERDGKKRRRSAAEEDVTEEHVLAETCHSSLKPPSISNGPLHRQSPPQGPSGQIMLDEDHADNPPNSVQEAQESCARSPLLVSGGPGDGQSDERSPRALLDGGGSNPTESTVRCLQEGQGESTANPATDHPDAALSDPAAASEDRNMPPEDTPQTHTNDLMNDPDSAPSDPSDGEGGELERTKPEIDSSLKAAFKAVNRLGLKRVNTHLTRYAMPKIKTEQGSAVLEACDDVRKCMNEIQALEESNAPSTTPEVRRLVSQLSTKALEMVRTHQWDQNSAQVRDIFVHVLPKLVMLLRDLLRHYGNKPHTNLSYEQLGVSCTLMTAIFDLGTKACRTQAQIKTAFPVKSLIKKVVRKIGDSLKQFRARKMTIRHQRETAKRLEEREEDRRRQEAEMILSEQKEKLIEDWKSQWNFLHSERTTAELIGRSLLSRSKQDHLRLVPLEESSGVELDGNGDPIERIQLFTQRRTLPPGHRGGGQIQPWVMDHSYALIKGLEELSGPQVYRNIFWACCRRGQPLNNYNVSEIIDQAMWLREEMIKDDEENGREPAGWILQIFDPRVPPPLDTN